MLLYHSKITKEGSQIQGESHQPLAMTPLLGYRMYLAHSWPEIKNEIQIGFVMGTNGSEICFSHSLGRENEYWLSFVHNGIALPIALENWKNHGINRFVFFCNDERREITPDELYERTPIE